jgi:hypothetical protein
MFYIIFICFNKEINQLKNYKESSWEDEERIEGKYFIDE